jgi:hypothetical protein
LGPLILLLPKLEIIWLCNLSILNVPDEGLFQKRVVRTKFDIYVFSSPGRKLLSSLFVRRPSVNISHFNLLLRNHWANCNQTLVEWFLDGPLPKLCPTKMAAKLKIEKRGDAILIVHWCFSISQNELKF